MEFGLEGGLEFLGVGEVTSGEGFAFGEALLLGGEAGGEFGAGGGEIGGQLSVEGGELTKVVAGGGEFGGDAMVVGAGGIELGGAGSFPAAHQNPGEGTRERGGEKGAGNVKKHVNSVGTMPLQINA